MNSTDNKHKLLDNFWAVGFDGDKSVYYEDLGWSDSIKSDAQSDYPELIFRYVVEIAGFNILFYWIKDKNFYVIETEKTPIEVRRLYLNPNWKGDCEYHKAGMDGTPSTCSPGDIIAIFQDPTRIWNELTIDFIPIGDILSNSLILALD